MEEFALKQKVPSKKGWMGEPEVIETKEGPMAQHVLQVASAQTGPQNTDFTAWNETEIREFLERRGEDYDDCKCFEDLVSRAVECERNTGPATRGGAGMHTETAMHIEEEEEDPLDAFMKEIEQQDIDVIPKKKSVERCDQDDPGAEFMASGAYANSLTKKHEASSADDTTRDDNEKGDVGTLAPVKHDFMSYEPFEKDFYEEVKELANLDAHAVVARRKALEIGTYGGDVPCPVDAFAQCGFDARMIQNIENAGYISPTAIQAQAIPAILSGRDVMGIAQTGSGKTAAYVLPMVVHILDQRVVEKGEGPIALLVAPTRELAEQIHRETRKFGRGYSMKICAAFGGLSKYQQIKELKAGVDVAVCTPGRMIDLIRSKACTMKRVTYVVLDEADRMFDMGFEPQIRSLLGQIRQDRQTMLFTATMPRKIEKLASDALTQPVRIVVGKPSGVNIDIIQHAIVVPSNDSKYNWLTSNMERFVDAGNVIVFANQKSTVEAILEHLLAAGMSRAAALHGDMDPNTRMNTLAKLKSDDIHVLVATDVAARGIDIHSIKIVVNFDAPKDSATYVHRIGRTGRDSSQKDGESYTLLVTNESKQASDVVEHMTSAGQDPPAEVMKLAAKYERKKRKRDNKSGKAPRRKQDTRGIGTDGDTNKKTVSDRQQGPAYLGAFVSSGVQETGASKPQIIYPKAKPPESQQQATKSSMGNFQDAISRAQAIAQRLAQKHDNQSKTSTRWDAKRT